MNDWNPTINVGLHHKLYSEKFCRNYVKIDERGKYLNNKIFSKKIIEHNDNLIISTNYEIKGKILKTYLSHYLMKDVVKLYLISP